ncbi:MAG: hypothetical protein WCC87_18340 [Candidatus Korobacteraceae bacterium]
MTENPKTAPDFHTLRKQLTLEIERLRKEHKQIEGKILSLKASLRGIDRYLEAELDHLRLDPVPLEPRWDGLRELGLTDAVRRAIYNSLEPINAKQIRDQLEFLAYPKLPKKNPLAAIHAILTRLTKNGEILQIEGGDKKPVYEWKKDVWLTDAEPQYGAKGLKAAFLRVGKEQD